MGRREAAPDLGCCWNKALDNGLKLRMRCTLCSLCYTHESAGHSGYRPASGTSWIKEGVYARRRKRWLGSGARMRDAHWTKYRRCAMLLKINIHLLLSPDLLSGHSLCILAIVRTHRWNAGDKTDWLNLKNVYTFGKMSWIPLKILKPSYLHFHNLIHAS